MGSDKKPPKGDSKQEADTSADNPPGWADGLKELYDSVVEEPLPPAFLDLLDKFDEEDSSDSKASDS